MASTYSNLKIQLMATGENSGTWGNVTNVNLGTALEEAIAGSADVAFSSGDVTLTLTDTNASQTARNMRLNLTGTTGGARSLIVPAVEKMYVVNNGCADAVTVKVSGQTGVAVPAGKTMILFNNGTDVVDAVNHLSSLTLGTDLAVTEGGTGASDAATARTNLGLAIGTDVLAPNGSGASLTSLNASSISSGTLSSDRLDTVTVAKGGTGATSLNANAVVIGNGTSTVTFVDPGTSGNVLTSNGTAWASQAISAGGDYVVTTFTSSGTWTKPANIKAIRVTVVGAGGGGESASAGGGGTQTGSNGGAAGQSVTYLSAPSIPGPVAVTVGTGGTGNPAPVQPTNATFAGNQGNTSSFGPFASATGGGPGSNRGQGSGGNIVNCSGMPINIYNSTPPASQPPSFTPTPGPNAPADRFGGGGGGAYASDRNPKSATGGTGAIGQVIVEEFY